MNDTYGHIIGDEVLVNLVNLCKQYIRDMDIFARFGRDEFIILMPDTDIKSAQETAEIEGNDYKNTDDKRWKN